ncbi:MAG: class I SAM-dependent methyltransferase, partial [Hyphomicrobium sp.]
REIRERTSFVMVSHSMPDIRSFCSSVIVMNKGRAVFSGTPDAAIEVYESLQFPDAPSLEKKLAATLAPQFENPDAIDQVEHFWCDRVGNRIDQIVSGDPVWFHLSFVPRHTPRKLTIGVPVWSEDGVYVTGFSTELGNFQPVARAGERAEFRLEVPALSLNPGIYMSNAGVLDGPEFLYRKANPVLSVEQRHARSIGYPGWGLIYHLLLSHLMRGAGVQDDQILIETGSNVGCTSIILGQALADAGVAGHVYSFELDPANVASARANLQAAGVADRVTVIEGSTLDTLPKFLENRGGLRFCFLDASHMFDEVLHEFETVLPALADDALVLFDNTYRIAGDGEDQRVNGALKEIQRRHGGNLINLEYVSWFTPGLAIWQKTPKL